MKLSRTLFRVLFFLSISTFLSCAGPKDTGPAEGVKNLARQAAEILSLDVLDNGTAEYSQVLDGQEIYGMVILN